MKFGVAKEIITPKCKTKVACCGKCELDFITIHDDVYCRCIIFDDGANKAITMSFDLLFHDRSLNNALKDYAFKKYGINKDAVCVSYTHAHTAPAVKGYNPGYHTDEYEEFLIERGKDCIDRAFVSMFEGKLEYGRADVDLNISRRGIINGKYDNCPNFNYEHDTELFVLCVKDTNGNIKAALVNYACHPVFYPAQQIISGEFPARVCQHLETKYSGCTALYFQSAGGDVRPAPTVNKNDDGSFGWKSMTFADIDNFAASMCEEVGKIVESDSMKTSDLSVSADEFVTVLEMDPAPLSLFQKEWEFYKGQGHSAPITNSELIANGGYEKLEKSMDLYCQIIKLTPEFLIATIGGEPCYGIKKTVKEALKDYDTCFIGYTDACAYVPDDKVLQEGGYEAECHVEYGLIGPFKKGINEKLTKNFKEALKKITN
ncbi:MAG: hypothetical protein E7560_01545 [Ruminococcaceae bacterium]|nr:hypothetical protein [Oscillospiraceae bacterium]